MLPSASGIGSSLTEGEDAFVQSQQIFGHLDEAQVSFRLLGRLCELLRSQTACFGVNLPLPPPTTGSRFVKVQWVLMLIYV